MKRPLLVSLLVLAIAWVGHGIYVTYLILIEKNFDSISPPTTLFGSTTVDFYFRLIDPVVRYSVASLAVLGFIVPIVVLLILGIYIFKKRNNFGKKRSFFYLLISLVIIVIFDIIFLLVIPGCIEWSILRIKASLDTRNAINYINGKPVKVYLDYGASGGLLAILMENKEKFSFYESFYLPLYLSGNKDIQINKEINSSSMFLFDNNLIIVNVKDEEFLKKIILPIANNLLINSFSQYISPRNSKLKIFEVIPDEKYQSYYIQKIKNNLDLDLSNNRQAYAINKQIIDTYQSKKAIEDEQYKKLVVEYELKYENGCIKEIIYNDCQQFKNIIEDNKKTIRENRNIIDTSYEDAIKYNIQINKAIAEYEKNIKDITNGSNTLENNKGEYSVGVAFDNDTIYLRYFKENPINSEILRIMIHELLHSYSYSKSRNLPEPISEGITDYIALQAMGFSEINTIRASGYPIEVQIILSLLEKIKKDDLIRVYFNGSEIEFKKLFTTNFPSINYSDFISQTKIIFNKTYHVNGVNRSFDKGLIDHEEVRVVRKFLGLPERKFEHEQY